MKVADTGKWKNVACLAIVVAAVALAALAHTILTNPSGGQALAVRCNKLYYDTVALGKTEWLGIRIMQNPCDMVTMQEIIVNLKPDFIVETGTAYGGSGLYFATILSQISDTAKVITVDIDPQVEQASKIKLFRDRVEVIKGDSVGPETIAKIAEQVKGRKCMVTLDSDHRKAHVLKELRLYSQFVSTGSYLIVQDTNINGHPVLEGYGPGPTEAIEEFMKENKDFEVDRTMERQIITFNPSGYLKKVR